MGCDRDDRVKHIGLKYKLINFKISQLCKMIFLLDVKWYASYIVPVFWVILSDLKSTYEKEIDEKLPIFSDIVLFVSSLFVFYL